MRKLYLILIFAFIFIGNVSAITNDLGFFLPNTCVQIIQTCTNCSQNNLSSILITNGSNGATLTSYNPNIILQTTDNVTYNTSYCNTSQSGTYYVNGLGNQNGNATPWNYQFEVGYPQWLIIIVMIFAYGLAILGFFKYRNEWVSFAGGMIMVILGIYTTSFGIGVYNSTITLTIGYLTIVLGTIAMIIPVGEKVEDAADYLFRK